MQKKIVTYTESFVFNGIPFFYTFIKNDNMEKTLHKHEFYEIFLTLTDNMSHAIIGCLKEALFSCDRGIFIQTTILLNLIRIFKSVLLKKSLKIFSVISATTII